MADSRRSTRRSGRVGHPRRRPGARAIAAGSGLAIVATVLSGSVGEAATGPVVTVTGLGDPLTPSAANVHNHQAPTLADAIAYLDAQPAGGTVTFSSNLTGTIDLVGRLPLIHTPIHLDGPGAGRLTLKNTVSKAPPVLDVDAPAGTTVVSGLTISGGQYSGIFMTTPVVVDGVRVTGNSSPSAGGGIDAFGGNLTVENSTVSGNVSTARGGGGGIYAGPDVKLTIENSTIAGNRANYGGGINSWGSTVTTIENSTVSGNTALRYDGGIDLVGDYNAKGPTGTIVNSTIADNRAANGIGGIYLGDGGKQGAVSLTVIGSTISGNVAANGRAGGIDTYHAELRLVDSILAGNRDTATGKNASPDLAINGKGGRTTAQFSLIGDGTDTVEPKLLSTNGTDIVGTRSEPVKPGLDGLGSHGGATMTMPPGRHSPALGRGNVTLAQRLAGALHLNLGLDQRGRPRLGLFSSTARADGTDIGAVEVTQVLQTRAVTAGDERFSVSTAAADVRLDPKRGLPVTFTLHSVAGRAPKLHLEAVALQLSGERAPARRYTRAGKRVTLPLRRLHRGRHTLTATVTYRYRHGGHLRHLSRKLKLTIDVG